MKQTAIFKLKTCMQLAGLALATLVSGSVLAQGLPQTDIWLVDLTSDLPGQLLKVNTGAGYNNQPHFSVDGQTLYYTREQQGTDGNPQTDIAAYTLQSMITTMVNKTAESEYSPTPVPGRKALSVIQAESDQKQRLWAIDIDTGTMSLLLPGVEPVGYHAWVTPEQVAMFILGDSFTLQSATLGTDGSELLADNIGRSIRKHPDSGEVLYVDKNNEPWQIAALHLETKKVRQVMPLFPAGEDFTIDEQGNFWTGNGSRLYRRAESDSRWELIADFSALGIRNISRLATNPASDKIAIVSDHVVRK
jgi:hypothetical protein